MEKDTLISDLLNLEAQRQASTINLIASENYTSQAVREACASTLTNKYAEGFPGKRYYAGCSIVDQVESLAIDRAKKLFAAEHANVQPHSGSQANAAVYHALLEHGDTVLAMDLSAGGHLTHGYAKNSSGRTYQFAHYQVDKTTETLDYNEIKQLAKTHQPKLIIAGASSYAKAIDYAAFRSISDTVGALLLVDMAHIAGLIAANIHQNPTLYADIVTSTTHKTLRGPRGGLILCKKEYAECIDKAVMPGIQGGPLMHIIAAKAIAFHEALQPDFYAYQQAVVDNCKALAHALQSYGLRIVSGGTDTHQCTVDLTSTGISGKEAEMRLERIGITVNRNCIPFDTAKPWITSGIRLGTPAITSRGATILHMQQIASIVAIAVQPELNADLITMLSTQVQTILDQIGTTRHYFEAHSPISLSKGNSTGFAVTRPQPSALK